MIAVALDVADPAVLEVDFDPAAACAHVAGGVLHRVGDRRRRVDDLAHGLEWIGDHSGGLRSGETGRCKLAADGSSDAGSQCGGRRIRLPNDRGTVTVALHTSPCGLAPRGGRAYAGCRARDRKGVGWG